MRLTLAAHPPHDIPCNETNQVANITKIARWSEITVYIFSIKSAQILA
jgi:hypothetical protein